MNRTNLEDSTPHYEFKQSFLREMQVRTLMAAERQATALEKIADSLAKPPASISNAYVVNGVTPDEVRKLIADQVDEEPRCDFDCDGCHAHEEYEGEPVSNPLWYCFGNLCSETGDKCAGHADEADEVEIKTIDCGDPGCHLCHTDPKCPLCAEVVDEIWPADDSGLTTEEYIESWFDALAQVKGGRGFISWDDIRPKGDPIDSNPEDRTYRWTFTIELDSKSDDNGYLVKMHDSKTNKDRIIFRGTDRECVELWCQVWL